MAGPIRFALLVYPLTIDQIQIFVQKLLDQCRCGGGIVGVVAVNHDEYIGFDIGKHSPHDIAFALECFGADDRAGVTSYLHCAIR